MLKGVSTNRRVFNARLMKAQWVFLTVVLKLFLVHKVTKRFTEFSEKDLPSPPLHPPLAKTNCQAVPFCGFCSQEILTI